MPFSKGPQRVGLAAVGYTRQHCSQPTMSLRVCAVIVYLRIILQCQLSVIISWRQTWSVNVFCKRSPKSWFGCGWLHTPALLPTYDVIVYVCCDSVLAHTTAVSTVSVDILTLDWESECLFQKVPKELVWLRLATLASTAHNLRCHCVCML
jgi:hypothetical protein